MLRTLYKANLKATRHLNRSTRLLARSFSSGNPIIGIDLGTTNSCVSVAQGEKPVIIENSEGQRTTPSVIAFTNDGTIVGDAAKRQAVTNPANTFYATKRLIGRKFADPEIQNDMKNLAFKVVGHSNGDAWVETASGEKYSPSQMGAFVLTKMKETAEKYLGKTVSNAVITVPAYFNDAQRQATKDAGEIAGLKVERIINEPTAAAMAYGLDKEDSQNLAVYDLGGGTFDISILEMTGGVFEVKATNGDTSCGGEDVDSMILNHLLKVFQDQEGLDLSKDKIAIQRIKEAAERAKIELSTRSSAEINLPYITMVGGQPKHLVHELKKTEFDDMIKAFVKRTLEPCKKSLKDAGMTTSDIDNVILVGGSTRIPLVQEIVQDFYGKKPSKGVNPDEAVAMGAAIQSGIMEGGFGDIILIDVVPLSLGIELQGGVFSKIIERNQAIPCSNKKEYVTVEDNQTSITIPVYQGEREFAKDNKFLGQFTLSGLAPAPRGVAKVETTMTIDNNGILNVTAKDPNTGKEESITVQPSGGLTQNEIDRMVKDAQKSQQEDSLRKELVDVKNELDQTLHQARKAVEEFADRLPEDGKQNIEKTIQEVQGVHQTSENLEELKSAKTKLNNEVMKIGQLVYQGSTGGGGNNTNNTSGDNNQEGK